MAPAALPITLPITLSIIDDAAGGLVFLLCDGQQLALQARHRLPPGGLAPWSGDAGPAGARASAGLLAFGTTLAAALLPPGVRQALTGQPPGPLRLQITDALAAVPWELAVLGPLPCDLTDHAIHGAPRSAPQPLGTRFAVQRQLLVSMEPTRRPLPAGDDVRQITILACDLVGSTGLMHRLGDEEYSERLTHYHQRVADIARQHAGLADDPQGDDGLMCYFGYPTASEDAAAAALRAGLALSRALDDLGLQVRIGISTGRVVIRHGQPVGSAVHHAARLQGQAPAGGVLASAATRQIAGERFEYGPAETAATLKGFEGVGGGGAVYRVLGERPVQGTERFDAQAHLTAFIGREPELQRLHQHWRATLAGRRQVLMLQGEAGIGKSRLVREFRQSLAAAGHRTLECCCAPEHSGSAFQPLIDVLRRRLQIQDGDDPALQRQRLRQLEVTTGPGGQDALALLGALLSLPAEESGAAPDSVFGAAAAPDAPGGSAEQRRQRTMDLLLRVAQGLTDQAPVCLIFEDVHWIDPSTQALVQRLIDGPPHQPVLLLITVRTGPGLAAAPFQAPVLALTGLGADAARSLVQGAIGGALLDADLVRWLADRADGVPLYIEESARMAALLAVRQPGADVAGVLRDAVPETLQGLLMARLDQLPQAKQAAQLGGALGRSFSPALIHAVNGHAASPIRLSTLGAGLADLARAGLLSVQGEGDHQLYVFKHALVRDAAHQSLLARDRRQLHGAIAAVLQSQFGALCDSQPERLALHYEQAGLDAQALAAWQQAAYHAAQRQALGEAMAHLRRALALLARQPAGPARDRTELALQLLLANRLVATAGYGADAVAVVYDRARVLADGLGGTGTDGAVPLAATRAGAAAADAAALVQARLGLAGYHFMRADFDRAQAIVQQVVHSLGPQPDAAARRQSAWAQAVILFHQGQLQPALALLGPGAAPPSVAGAPAAVAATALRSLSYSAWALWQLGQADRALHLAQQAVAQADALGHPGRIGEACGFLAVVHHFRGETRAGLQAAQRAITCCEAGGFSLWLAQARVVGGRLLAEQGDVAAGLAAMRQGLALWAASGAVVTRPFHLALLAEGLALAGQPDEALAHLDDALALVERSGERFYAPELLRLKGVLWLQAGRPDGQAAGWLHGGLALAQDGQMNGLALRCATSVARLLAGQGRPGDAMRTLAGPLARISEGQQTQDPRHASALLARCLAAGASA